jgi:S1-C subfamily serine protease
VDYPFGNDRKSTSRGSGFLVDKERGWILTNAHVASRSPSNVRVSFKDQPYTAAHKVYVDNHLDLAIIKVDQSKIPASAVAANLLCSNEPSPGLPVIAFGHPWGLDYTATRGIISGTKSLGDIEQLQTDAALNPGNSGGPLIDEKTGDVVGVNASGMTKSDGLNFAVPIKLVCTILDLLKDGKNPSPPIIPMSFGTTLRERELLVAGVKGDWAQSLKIGDRILAVNGDRTARYSSRFLDKIRGKDSVRIIVSRDDKELEMLLAVPKDRDEVKRLGVHFSGMTIGKTTLASFDPSVMFIHFIDDASTAEQAQFREGDRVISIDGIETASHEDVLNALKGKQGKDLEFIFKRPRNNSSALFDHMSGRVEIGPITILDERGIRN